MKDEKKTKRQLIDELTAIRKLMAEVEVSKDKQESHEERSSHMGIARDMTDRKREEEELGENEGKYRSLSQEFREILDAIPDGLILLSPDLKVVWENERAKSGHLEQSDISDQHCYHIKHGRSEPCEYCVAPECLASGQPRVGESITPDGRIWELRFFPVFDDKGGVKGVIEVAHNITERRQAEDALRESENRYRTIFQTTGTTMLIVEEDMTISLANHGFESLSGYEREEIEGEKKWTEFVEEGDLEKMVTQHQLRRADSGVAKKSYEFRLVRRDGRLKNIFLTVDLIPGTKRSVASLMDITDRRQAEEALAESEARYKLIADNVTDTLWLMDMDLRTTWCSPSVVRSRGYSFEEINALPVERHVTPESIEIILKTLSEELTPERLQQKDLNISRTLELEFYRKDGSTCWSEARVTLLRDPQGSPIGLLGVGRDITERKRVQEALLESKEQYQFVVENLKEVVFRTDAEGHWTFLNSAWAEVTGFAVEESLGKVFLEFVYPEDRQLNRELFRPLIERKKDYCRHEIRYMNKNGGFRWIEVWARLTLDEKGDATGTAGTLTDITERKLAEAALHKSEEKYRTILENIEEGYHEVDLPGNFTCFNDSFERIMGYGREELMGMSYKQYSADEENSRNIFHAYNRVYRTGEPLTRFEWDIIRKDGVRRSLEVSASLIKDSSGRPQGFRGIVTDITDRKRADDQRREMEERLQRAEKMELMGILAGGVAHDLNNVLGIVIGYSEMLLMDANQPVWIRPSLEKIMNGGQKAAAIVQDLLTLARRGVSGREVLNLNKIIADCRKSPEFEKLSSYHPSVEIKTDLDPRLFNVSGSSVHLGKTLFNLVSNASESMPRGGVLTIKTANQYLGEPIQGYDEVREGDYVVLSVSDTGEGIPAADLKRIFEPFYTKKVMGRSGTGLGLAVVWGTVKDHKGYINVESEEGKGSVFTICFPVTREDISAEAPTISIFEYMGKGESILIVDDVEEQRDLAAGMLRKLNYNVVSVASGEEAIAYLKEHQADLMVLDMIMDPGMDGLDTYRKILEIHPKQKAIIVSGFSETERVIAAQALGAGAYLRKPYIIEKLGFAVRRELERE